MRVPTPREVLCVFEQEPDDRDGEDEEVEIITIVASSYLRQLRDMTKQRVLLMGGSSEEFWTQCNIRNYSSMRVDVLDVVDKRHLVEKEKRERKKEDGIVYRWESWPLRTTRICFCLAQGRDIFF